MFHYRLVPTGNLSRMLTAVFLAAVLHIGLMNFDISPKPVATPEVSLPHSVTVFLKQNNFLEPPVSQVEKEELANHLAIEKPAAKLKTEKPSVKEISPLKVKKDIPLKQTAIPEKVVRQAYCIVFEFLGGC